MWSEALNAEQSLSPKRDATSAHQSIREDQGERAFGRPARGEMSRKVILLVEDNPDDELLTVRALRKTGVKNEVVVAHDGVEALDYLFASGPHAGRDPAAVPQLILLDLKLPRVGGLEVLKRLRSDERTRRLPVVILSSSRERRDMLDGYGFGANSYVRKPVNFEQFVTAIELLRRYWLVLNEDPPGVF